jgi:hypothetical protein
MLTTWQMRIRKENVCACVGKAVIPICTENTCFKKNEIYVQEKVFGVFMKRRERIQTK